MKQIRDAQVKYRAGDAAALPLELIGFLNRWMVDHVRSSDKKYGPYLNARGII